MRRIVLGIAAILLACGQDAPQAEPGGQDSTCPLVPAEGVCSTVFEVERCVSTADGPTVVREECPAGEVCLSSRDEARCQPITRGCVDGASFCSPDHDVVICAGGGLHEMACEFGCSSGVSASFCRNKIPGTVLLLGEVRYEHRVPNADRTGLDTELRPAAGLGVYSFDGSEYIDTAVVGADGTFEILVRAEPDEGDSIELYAGERLMGQATTTIGVIHPHLEPGVHRLGSTGDEASTWKWTLGVPQGGEPILITREMGSGAIQIFQALRRTVGHLASHLGLDSPDLLGWYQPGVDYECGAACYLYETAPAFRGHVGISAGELDASSLDSTIYHQAGLHAYSVLGSPVSREAARVLGEPAPGHQALPEGYAIWYAADRLKDPRYFGTAGGSFFSFDLDRMRPEAAFARPAPSLGARQDLDPVWVAAVLWQLAEAEGTGRRLHAVLGAAELTPPLASGGAGAVLADYLDALVCRDLPTAPIRANVEPHYPYDATSPSCR